MKTKIQLKVHLNLARKLQLLIEVNKTILMIQRVIQIESN
jgi:hypothetical protein